MKITIEKRIEMERKIVRHLIREAKQAGWIVMAVDDGGDEPEKVFNETETMDAVFAVDEAQVYFQKTPKDGKRRTRSALIVLGNYGWDCIADHSAPDNEVSFGWNEMMDRVSEYADKLGESL
jgi:DNA-binding transcriptional regulator LsrR (DeoR family)